MPAPRRRYLRVSPSPCARPGRPPRRAPDRLAGLAGLAPVPRDYSRINGNLHRPRRYHRGLQRVFYYSAMNSIRWSDESRRFYARKRAEGKRHTRAVLALARRRVNVLRAMLRDQRLYQTNRAAATAAS